MEKSPNAQRHLVLGKTLKLLEQQKYYLNFNESNDMTTSPELQRTPEFSNLPVS